MDEKFIKLSYTRVLCIPAKDSANKAEANCIPTLPPGFELVTPLKEGERLCLPGETPTSRVDADEIKRLKRKYGIE